MPLDEMPLDGDAAPGKASGMPGAYDHAEKSGNEGDVVKHVGLLAALDSVLGTWPGGFFRYADTFAGYAQCVLGDGGEWPHGVGLLADRERLGVNPHTALWRRWYLARPVVRGSAYPGSSLVAADVARDREVPIHLALWDVSGEAVESLRATWGDRAFVFHRPAEPREPAVVEADFLFVDPPDLDAWSSIRPTLEPSREGGTLLWLPVLKGDGDAPHARAVEDVRALGYGVEDVRWTPRGGRTVGCRLVHRLPHGAGRALEAAVRHVARVAGWLAHPDA